MRNDLQKNQISNLPKQLGKHMIGESQTCGETSLEELNQPIFLCKDLVRM